MREPESNPTWKGLHDRVREAIQELFHPSPGGRGDGAAGPDAVPLVDGLPYRGVPGWRGPSIGYCCGGTDRGYASGVLW